MRVNLLSLKEPIWQGMTEKVILPAADGQICVLDFHQSFLIRLKKGNITLPHGDIFITDGIAFMRHNELTIFIENQLKQGSGGAGGK